MNYIQIEHIVYGETVDQQMVEAILELELVDARKSATDQVVIAEKDCEEFRAMLRLMVELDINPAGIATIMHMRRKMQAMQEELRALRMLHR